MELGEVVVAFEVEQSSGAELSFLERCSCSNDLMLSDGGDGDAAGG
jgi:hypothetical protein